MMEGNLQINMSVLCFFYGKCYLCKKNENEKI